MPELPEVETIVRALRNSSEFPWREQQSLAERPGIVNRVIQNADVYWRRTVAIPGVEEFLQRVAGQSITQVERRGKFVVLTLTKDFLLFHLRMSGDLRVEPQTCPLEKHDRLRLNFSDGMRLVFNDTRKFGRAWLVTDPEEVTGELGPEPFAADFTSRELYQRLQKSKRNVKTMLLDQTVLAGVGNIYSDEALFRARIHPATPANEITLRQSVELMTAIRMVMEEGILRNGASIDWVYRGGDFQNTSGFINAPENPAWYAELRSNE
jgi:formamidopyrimidine-DNA glycosylase